MTITMLLIASVPPGSLPPPLPLLQVGYTKGMHALKARVIGDRRAQAAKRKKAASPALSKALEKELSAEMHRLWDAQRPRAAEQVGARGRGSRREGRRWMPGVKESSGDLARC